jgi:hypothetical protein
MFEETRNPSPADIRCNTDAGKLLKGCSTEPQILVSAHKRFMGMTRLRIVRIVDFTGLQGVETPISLQAMQAAGPLYNGIPSMVTLPVWVLAIIILFFFETKEHEGVLGLRQFGYSTGSFCDQAVGRCG